MGDKGQAWCDVKNYLVAIESSLERINMHADDDHPNFALVDLREAQRWLNLLREKLDKWGKANAKKKNKRAPSNPN